MSVGQEPELDERILAVASEQWQAVALLIAKVRSGNNTSAKQIAARIEVLVDLGRLEAQGNLSHWRHSEARLPA